MGIFHNDNDFSKYLDKDLSGSQTEKNLLEAFCGESQARNKYSFFAKQARKDGYEQIAKIFEETANNEAEHGKIWYRLLYKGKMPSTLENLENAASAENYEWENMYANFASTAREEGYEKIACLFELIRNIEKMHMQRYQRVINHIKKKSVFQKETPVIRECAKCGYTYENESAPDKCPFCQHPKAYFFERCKNY